MYSLGFIARAFQMSLSEIARKLEVTPQTVNDWVKGKSKIPKKRVKELANIFKLSEEYFEKNEAELNEVDRLMIELKYLQSINKLKEDKKYRYWSHQNEISRLNKKIEDKKLLLEIEKLFDGGGRIGDLDYNPQGVKNYLLFNEMVNVLSSADENREKIDQLVIFMLGERQKRAFDIAERIAADETFKNEL